MANRKLSRYRAKRDFRHTAEPQGSARSARSAALRYVIQKHAARRLHYDLRLELGGVFKSWAITRGPSLNPADKRLAVEVEDHPLDYGDFEGTIPAGQYGGGTVQLWDRGYWQPLAGGDPEQALRAGELKFTLDGQRLHGSWVLVRMRRDRSGSKRNNWLLIKHRDAAADAAAADELLLQDRSVASGRTLAQITQGTGKRPTPFMTRKTRIAADAVWHSQATPAPAAAPRATAPATGARTAGPMPRFIEPQLCTLVEQPAATADWGHEVKLDGYRLQLRVERGRASLMTRSGLDWSEKFGPLARVAARLPDCLLDGEAVALDAHGAPNFSALQAALSQRDPKKLIYYAFDLLWQGREDLRPLPLRVRKQRLRQLLRARRSNSIRYLEALQQPGPQVLRSACDMQFEGIVSKRLDAAYVSGRGGSWTKSKCRTGHEVVIGGWTLRAGSVRSLLVGVYDRGTLRYTGRVGTGFGQRAAKLLLPQLQTRVIQSSPFVGAGAPVSAADVRWVRPELVAEIEFAGWTGGGMVRQAAFKGLREDKPAREVRAERPVMAPPSEIESALDQAAAKQAPPAARAASDQSATVMGQRISHPDKALWPDAGDDRAVTKLELARYFESVGDWMMPHLQGRPCSLLRLPDGLAGQRFFQRHAMPGMSEQLDLVKVSGDRQAYVEIEHVEGLIAAAQIAALELHPWNCVAHQPEKPGRFVFDLDPAPDVKFELVIQAAIELRARLERLGLTSFCKTTGGKGLHVVVPLAEERNGLDWNTAKTFTQTVCAQMAADSPARYLTTMAKKDRVGRIFLDYLRNDRMATAVAPLSPRARDGASVSMPLHWQQVRVGLEPRRYTLRSAPALLRRQRPWDDYARIAQSLRAAIERLTRASAAPAKARAPKQKARRAGS